MSFNTVTDKLINTKEKEMEEEGMILLTCVL